MRKRPKLTLALASAAVVAPVVIVVSMRSPPEPTYEGRTLSEWAAAYYSGGPYYPRSKVALETIGTNALPFAIKWLRSAPEPWKNKARRVVEKLPKSLPPQPIQKWLSTDESERCMEKAFAVILVLREEASPVAPDLFRLSTHSAITALQSHYAVELSSYMGTNALPGLIQLLQDTKHPYPQRVAALAIGEILHQHPTAIAGPALVQCLRTTDPGLRDLVADFMGASGGPVDASRKAFAELLTETNPSVLLRAASALRRIAPEDATNTPAQ